MTEEKQKKHKNYIDFVFQFQIVFKQGGLTVQGKQLPLWCCSKTFHQISPFDRKQKTLSAEIFLYKLIIFGTIATPIYFIKV